ncbi:N-succinyl-L,L-diaminopimelate aminotransferase, type 2 [hydrothermal vent metagenome]|uniref:N-succinyl-L,L-diaminopimelate aminotransferase, type 2 n=1 Tax=hydrothermal vent metagenome TaxID=652676 RepID=A0A3B0ZZN2_9ZZZZ
MNPDLHKLHPYPFEKLRELKSGISPPKDLAHIALSIGEPKHETPEFVLTELTKSLANIGAYPSTLGDKSLRQAVANWLEKRFKLPSDSIHPDFHVLPVTGTREALFSFTQCIIDKSSDALVLMPNPFYQIYEGAALLAGAKPYYLNSIVELGNIPDYHGVPDDVWQQCQLLNICTPSNPSGAVLTIEQLQSLIKLSEKFDFVIASDECYSEIYFDETQAPPGLLQAAALMGNNHYERCMVFHSLSKRSNLPGLRSGFVAGDKNIIKNYLKYRTYQGCAMPPHHQTASTFAWQDEQHVIANRGLYTQKFQMFIDILKPVIEINQPDAAFYVWLKTPINDQEFAKKLYQQQNVTVLPGSFLSRTTNSGNPGKNYVRLALVSTVEECNDAANRIKSFVKTL